MDDLESYQPKSPQVLSVEPGWAVVYLEEATPASGEAIAVDSGDGRRAHLVVRERLGGRRVRAMHLGGADWLAPEMPAEATGRPAGFRLGEEGEVDVRTTSLEPRPEGASDDSIPIDWSEPEFSDLRGELPPLQTGYEAVDSLTPLVRGGTNLLLDLSGDDRASDRLTDVVFGRTSPDRIVRAPLLEGDSDSERVDHPVRAGDHGHQIMAAIRCAVALGVELRHRGLDSVVSLELPTVGRSAISGESNAAKSGYGRIVDLVGSALASTADGEVTTLLRIAVPPAETGLASIVETTDLGDVDAQIVIDGSGRYAPGRSTSDADRPEEARSRGRGMLETLRAAERAREKRQVFGVEELSESESEAMRRADALRVDLTQPPDG